jgi:fluoride exporter
MGGSAALARGADEKGSRAAMQRRVPPDGYGNSVTLPFTPSVLIAIGGLVGSLARYWLSGAAQTLTGAGFPSGTLVVNVLGSFVIGLVMALSLDRGVIDDDLRILLTTGFCGGFTTMSTFSYETLALLRDGEQLLALGNVGVTLAACLGAVWFGSLVARLL